MQARFTASHDDSYYSTPAHKLTHSLPHTHDAVTSASSRLSLAVEESAMGGELMQGESGMQSQMHESSVESHMAKARYLQNLLPPSRDGDMSGWVGSGVRGGSGVGDEVLPPLQVAGTDGVEGGGRER